MPPIQRYAIVALSAAYWAISVLCILVIYSWIDGAKDTLAGVLIKVLLAGLLGAAYGLLSALVSYFTPIKGAWFQRATIGLALGLVVALGANLAKPPIPAMSELRDLEYATNSYPVAGFLFLVFGLATPRRIFFAIAK